MTRASKYAPAVAASTSDGAAGRALGERAQSRRGRGSNMTTTPAPSAATPTAPTPPSVAASTTHHPIQPSMSIASFFKPTVGEKRSRDEGEPSSLRQPLSLAAWNANSLGNRIAYNGALVKSFLATEAPDLIFVSEVRFPAAGPPGCKANDGKPRRRGELSKRQLGALARGRSALGLHSLKQLQGVLLALRFQIRRLRAPRQARCRSAKFHSLQPRPERAFDEPSPRGPRHPREL